jgi:hypothetical protein
MVRTSMPCSKPLNLMRMGRSLLRPAGSQGVQWAFTRSGTPIELGANAGGEVGAGDLTSRWLAGRSRLRPYG